MSVSLLSNNTNTRWVLDSRYLKSCSNMKVSDEGYYLYIDNVVITLSESAGQISVINREGIFLMKKVRKCILFIWMQCISIIVVH
ncbi:MAG: hypothetical protein ACL7BU_09125 [Candidatus Phlomobacter fragariae]